MKKILLTTTALIALGMAPAAAADLAARPYTKAPAARLRSITGPASTSARWAATPRKTALASAPLSGGFAGGTARLQLADAATLVLGLEADGAWADVGRNRRASSGLASVNDTDSPHAVPFAAASATPSTRSCSTAPAATPWADNRLSTTCARRRASRTARFHSGWTVGAGVEVMFAPKWSVKAEYLYRSFEGRDLLREASGAFRRNHQPEQRQVGVNYHFRPPA